MNTYLKATLLGLALFLATILVIESSGTLWANAENAPPSTNLPIPTGPEFKLGAHLYQRDCASCHGAAGDGLGALADTNDLLKPRNFRVEPFRFVSTKSGIPTRSDLIKTIQGGIPAAGMPPTLECSSSEVEALADYVWALYQMGVGKEKFAGEPIAIPSSLDNGSAILGKELFLTHCSACHGKDGTAQNAAEFPDFLGRLSKPRDLSDGSFHGGNTDEDLYFRIRCGLPGTVMPGFSEEQLTDSQVCDLIAFIRELSRN
ncbi:MAG: c-type cytochrome [Planctomycetota bacterium]|nr:c-type cytochrome [Planctomycetota bacterium]